MSAWRTRRRALSGTAAAAAVLLSACATGGGGSAASRQPLVLVAGATGKTGQQLVQSALAQSYRVRVLVRDEAKARALFGDRVDYAVGDVEKPDTLGPAMNGVRYVVSSIGAAPRTDVNDDPQRIDFRGVASLASAAKAQRVEHFVLVSSMGITQPDHFLNKMFNNQLVWKGKGEEALRASGVPYTIVRPGNLRDDPGGQMGLRVLQGDPRVQGRISRADVATVCIAALGRREAFGKTFELIGEGEAQVVDWPRFFGEMSADAPSTSPASSRR